MNILIAVLPLIIGFVLDAILGDPYSLPHPVRLTGHAVAGGEKAARAAFPGRERLAGTVLAVIVLAGALLLPLLMLAAAYCIHAAAGIVLEGIFCYYLIAAKCLREESMKVYHALDRHDVEGARHAVSMIVGRDTRPLDEAGIVKAAVETVAENTSDGVTAPMFYMALGGAPLGCFYKAANTMDSMLGYKNEKYLEFGRFAARFDDVMNFIPSRLTALLMIAAAYLCGMDGRNAWRIWRRDRFNHASPNSAQTEAVCAGALGVMLAGDAWYFGVLHKKKTIGDGMRGIEKEDIRRADRLMYVTAVLMLALAVAVRAGLAWLVLG